jgi:acyl carrier protein
MGERHENPPVDPRTDLSGAVDDILVRVLMVDVSDLEPEAELVRDLGAESIDFLDLLFQLEDLVGRRVTPEEWDGWITGRLPDPRYGKGITVDVIKEFALTLVEPSSSET